MKGGRGMKEEKGMEERFSHLACSSAGAHAGRCFLVVSAFPIPSAVISNRESEDWMSDVS